MDSQGEQEKLAKKNISNTKGVHQRQLGEGGSASEGHGPEPAGVTWIIAARVGLIKIAKVMGLGKG